MIVSLVFLPAGISQPRRGRWIYEIPVTFLCQYGQGGFTFPEEKGYAHPFASDTRKLFKIGVNFSNKTRNIETWKVVERNLELNIIPRNNPVHDGIEC